MFRDVSLSSRNPFPDSPVTVAGFKYRKALYLTRLTDAPDRPDKRRVNFVVERDYCAFWVDENGTEHEIVVPRGMVTDLASVPAVWRILVSRTGPWLEASVVHDFLCIAWIDIDNDGSQARRKFADDVMFAAMEEAGVDAWRKWAIYIGLRAYAAVAYPKRATARQAAQLYVDLDDPALKTQFA